MSESRKVLVILATDRLSGPARQILQFFKYMDRNRYELCLACTWLLCHPYADFFVEATARGVIPIFLKQRSPFDPTPIIAAYTLIRERKINLIQTHGYKPGLIGYVLSLLTGLPWVAFVHGDTAENRKIRVYNRLNIWLTRRADRVIAVSCAIRDQLVTQGVEPDKIYVVHNAIDPSEFAQGNTGSGLRESFDLAVSDRVIAVIGRFSPEKGQLDFVEAFSRLARERSDLKAFLVGEGDDEPALRKRCLELGIEDQVVFTGYQQDIAPFYDVADLIVMPSLSEGLPNVALEALLHHRPILATRVGGTPEVVLDGITGLLVPPSDPVAMANGMARLLDSPQLCRELVENGIRLLRDEYSPEIKASRLAAVYDDLLMARNG